MQETLRVKALLSYPVKSMRAISHETSTLQVTGLPHDRQYMVVNDTGDFITQRKIPRMALISPKLTASHLIFSVDGTESARVELAPALAQGKRHALRVFDADCYGIDLGPLVSDWLTEFLGEAPGGGALKLMCFDPQSRRSVSKKHLKGEDSHTLFADGYPYLVASEATLSYLNAALLEKGSNAVTMDRFRPNIVVDGTIAFDEFEWEALEATRSRVRLGLRKPCQRCEIVTVDQTNGEIPKKGQPLATLVKVSPLMAKGLKGGYFGMNTTLIEGAGDTLTVGDTLSIARCVASS